MKNPGGSVAMDMMRDRAGILNNPGTEAAAAESTYHRFSSRTNRYLSSLNFGFIKENFLRLNRSSTVSKRVNFLMFAVPVSLGALFGVIHYITHSFAIYLKY